MVNRFVKFMDLMFLGIHVVVLVICIHTMLTRFNEDFMAGMVVGILLVLVFNGLKKMISFKRKVMSSG